LGGFTSSYTSRLNGTINTASMYRKVLTISEITQNYESGLININKATYPTSPINVMVTGSEPNQYFDYMYYSYNGGTTMLPLYKLGQNMWFSSAMSTDSQHMYCSSYDGNLYKSSDGGANWTTTSSSIQYEIVCSDSGAYIYGIGYNGVLYRSSNYGASFTIPAGVTVGQKFLDCSANGQYVITLNNTFSLPYLKWSSNYGNSWSGTLNSTTGVVPVVCGVSDSGTYMVTYGRDFPNPNTQIVYSTNSGSSWVTGSTSIPYLINDNTGHFAMNGTGQYQVLILNNGPGSPSVYKTYVTNDYGSSWTDISSQVPMNTNNTGKGSVSSDGQIMYIVVKKVGLYKSTNYGVSWSLITPNTINGWRDVTLI
jgi:hypothetical protein